MQFAPINDDHAVEAVTFGLAMNRVLDIADVRALGNEYRRYSEELPAAAFLPQDEPGVEFAYRRPDGSAIWLLKLASNDITVECTRYTRWEKVWTQAASYLAMAIRALVQEEPETKFGAISLRVVDKFVSRSADYNLTNLFAHSDLLPPGILNKGAAWHCNLGWFEDSYDGARALHQLQLKGQIEKSYVVATDSHTSDDVVLIEHFQQLRKADFTGEELLERGALRGVMDGLHSRNKRTLAELLAPSVQEQIGLWTQQ